MLSSGPELDVNVREALPSDAERIAALCVQLGYDVPLAHVERSLRHRDADNEIFVAIVTRVGVIGWISVHASESLTSSRAGHIAGLVVEDEYRGVGIGAILLDRAERWARERGCPALSLRSNVIRERAHAFYERRGYTHKKSQHYFEKRLT
jgi:GNAT superfamily N-acetyltransferase